MHSVFKSEQISNCKRPNEIQKEQWKNLIRDLGNDPRYREAIAWNMEIHVEDCFPREAEAARSQ